MTRPAFIAPLIMIALSIGSARVCADHPTTAPTTRPRFIIVAGDADKDVLAALQPDLVAGIARVEQFFGGSFPREFVVEVCPNRAKFDEYFQRRWNMPKTSRWMVASGVADRLVILSPRVWKTEAVEHDPADAKHIRELVAHELVHVYHGQNNPRPDFEGMDEMGWFVEGLAVVVSGQLDNAHRTAAADAIKAGKAPQNLADAWSGRFRYGVCGSMVRFVDMRFGRKMVIKLLATTSNAEALGMLGMSEVDFLEQWRAQVSGG